MSKKPLSVNFPLVILSLGIIFGMLIAFSSVHVLEKDTSMYKNGFLDGQKSMEIKKLYRIDYSSDCKIYNGRDIYSGVNIYSMYRNGIKTVDETALHESDESLVRDCCNLKLCEDKIIEQQIIETPILNSTLQCEEWEYIGDYYGVEKCLPNTTYIKTHPSPVFESVDVMQNNESVLSYMFYFENSTKILIYPDRKGIYEVKIDNASFNVTYR